MDQSQNSDSMGLGSSATSSEPLPRQPPTWAQLKAMIHESIKKDDQPVVFEALLADVDNYMTELKRTGQLAFMSIPLQEDAAVFFSRRTILSYPDSKKALQKIINILKKQETAGAANDSMMMDQSQNSDSMGLGSSANPSEPLPRPPPSWAQLKAMIHESIKKDDQPVVFEALLADVDNYMTELKRTGQLAVMSIPLQEDAAVFFSRRSILSYPDSKKALQKIINILKKQ